MARVSAATAPLLAEYTARSGSPAVAAIEAVFTTAAWPDSRRYGQAARDTRAVPITFTSSTRCHSSSVLSATLPWAPIPALLTSKSRPPSPPAAASTADRTAASSVTSART